MKGIVLLFILLVASAHAVVLCQYGAQSAAITAGNSQTVVFTTAYAATDITCCTDETWAPVATELPGSCRCTFTAHIPTVPANTFDFYACANTM